MNIVWGIVIGVLSLLCWGGQAISWLAPSSAERLKLTESERAVEPIYHTWSRGEAMWDSLTLWTMLVAAVLLVLDNQAWAYFGLVGGGMYTYFAGLGIITRLAMEGRGFRIGEDVKTAYVFLALWGFAGAVTIGAAVVALSTS